LRNDIAWSFDTIVPWSDYTVDLLVENVVLVALKVAKAIDDIHRAQCLNDLTSSSAEWRG
jgi:hypothetical protein